MKRLSPQPIGLFDSGVGGLTIMRDLIKRLPCEDIVYFGDTARIPYGSKSAKTILEYSIQNSILLLDHNIKLLVIACHTASSHAAKRLRELFNIPVIDVIQPGAAAAVAATKNKNIAVIATKGTIGSGIYENEICHLLPGAQVHSYACPLFVPIVEESFIDHNATRLIVKEYLKPIKETKVDTLLLGCTHYPLLKKLIQEELGTHINIVDSATTCSEWIAEQLNVIGKQAEGQKGKPKFLVSDDPEKFKESAKKIFGFDIHNVERADPQRG